MVVGQTSHGVSCDGRDFPEMGGSGQVLQERAEGRNLLFAVFIIFCEGNQFSAVELEVDHSPRQ